MNFPVYLVLDACLLASEFTLAARRRSSQAGGASRSADRGSLRVLWVVISLAATAGHFVAQNGVGPWLTPFVFWQVAGSVLFMCGLVLRAWAVKHLGRFFTVDVAVAQDHRIVEDGPFRYVRHPSYSGLLLEFAGIGWTLGSITGWLVMVGPIFLVLLHRVRIEEAALTEAFGAPYIAYLHKTKRFVPGVF